MVIPQASVDLLNAGFFICRVRPASSNPPVRPRKAKLPFKQRGLFAHLLLKGELFCLHYLLMVELTPKMPPIAAIRKAANR
ncbi:hypothetical protein GCM10023228_06890 [Brevibacillus fulvus]